MKTLMIYNTLSPWSTSLNWFNMFEPIMTHSPVSEHRVKTKEAYEFKYEVPGFKKRDLNIKVDNESLVVEGEHNAKSSWFKKNENQSSISFRKSIWLSDDMDTDNINAKFKDGMLKLTIPIKKEYINYRSIPVWGTDSDAEIVETKEKQVQNLMDKVKNWFKKVA